MDANVLNGPFEEVLQKLAKYAEELRGLLEQCSAPLAEVSDTLTSKGLSGLAEASKILASKGLSAFQWLLDKLREVIYVGGEFLLDLIDRTTNTVLALAHASDLRDFLDEKFTPAFKTLDQDVIDGMPTKRHDLKGDAYSAYSGLVGKQVKAASDMVNASTKLSGQLNSAIIAMVVFMSALLAAIVAFIFGVVKAAAVASADPPASTFIGILMASKVTAATVAFIGAAFAAATTSWVSTATAIRAIKEIELVGSNKWPNSNLDYQEG